MNKSLLLCAAVLIGATVAAFGQTTTVDWANVSGTTYTLFDNLHSALSRGTANINQDGDLIELGYFTSASVGHEFSGTFTPLTTTTTIGDSANLTGAAAGAFGFNSFFGLGTTSDVYDPGSDPGHYTTTSAVSITTGVPAANQLLAIRFFSTHTGASGFYNTVAADSWQWQVPTDAGASVSINLVTTGSNNLVWQDAANPFMTTIATAIPEPSVLPFVAGALALSALVWRRRRR